MSSSVHILAVTALSAFALSAAAAHAGQTHILQAEVVGPQGEARTIAVAPGQRLSEASARALAEGLAAAGFQVVAPTANPQLVAAVSYDMRRLCTQACRRDTGHDDAPLSDYYTRRALVVAKRADAPSGSAQPVAWYVAMSSDGLSDRERDYLPYMLRAGAKAYGRTVEPGDR